LHHAVRGYTLFKGWRNVLKSAMATQYIVEKNDITKTLMSITQLKRLISVFKVTKFLNIKVNTGWAEKRATLLLSISAPIIDRFSKFFYGHTLWTICNNVIITYPTTQ